MIPRAGVRTASEAILARILVGTGRYGVAFERAYAKSLRGPSLSWLAFHLNKDQVEEREGKPFFGAFYTNSESPNVQKPAWPITAEPNQSIAFSAVTMSAKETILRSARRLPYAVGLLRSRDSSFASVHVAMLSAELGIVSMPLCGQIAKRKTIVLGAPFLRY